MSSFSSLLILSTILFYFLSPISTQSVPVICPAGSYYSSSINQCQLCPVGYYQNYAGRSECNKCPRDTYNNQEGAIECNRCSTGYYAPSTGSITCIVCKAGYYIDPAMAFQRLSLCLACPAGTYSNEAASSCINCLPGYYNDKEGSNMCYPCPSSTIEGAKTCNDISPNNQNIGENNNNNGNGLSSLSSTNKIIAIVGGSIGVLLLLGLISFIIYRQHQKKLNIEKNRLMIEQTKRSSLNRSSFSQSINNINREELDENNNIAV